MILVANDDQVLKLKITIQPIRKVATAKVTAVVEGKTFTYTGPTRVGEEEEVEVELPYEVDAFKEVPIKKQYPGVDYQGKYVFKLLSPK